MEFGRDFSWFENESSALIIGEAGILFVDYIYKHYNIRKCYADVYGYNKKSIKFLNTAGFVIEAELKEHRYHMFDYHSLYTFALYRDKFYKRFQNFLKFDT